jgi:hypothetical protein
VAVEEG